MRCGLCFMEMTDDEMNDCRSVDFDFKPPHAGPYFHNRCWNGIILYAQYRADKGDPICWDAENGRAKK